MKQIEIVIAGMSPLLMNRFTDEAQMQSGQGTSAVIVGSRGTPREQAEPKLYRDKSGRICVPGPNIFSGLIESGKFHKTGKSKVTTARSSLIPAGIQILDVECPLQNRGKKEPAWEVDSRPVVNPSTRGRRLCHRPRFDEWSLAFRLEIDLKMFDLKFVRQLVDDFGSRVGLGDFRPDRKGPFGRFKVVEWKEA